MDRAKLEPPTRRASDRTFGTLTEGRKTPFKSRTRTIDPGRSRLATAHGPPTGRIVFTRPDGVPGRPDTDGKAESCTGPTGSAAGPVAGRHAPTAGVARGRVERKVSPDSDVGAISRPQSGHSPRVTRRRPSHQPSYETNLKRQYRPPECKNRRKTGLGRKGPDRIAIPLLARNVRPQRTIKSKKRKSAKNEKVNSMPNVSILLISMLFSFCD